VVSNLLPRPVPGIGAESKFIESHLLDANGRVRDLDQVSREIGDATAQFTYLDYELREHLRAPMTRGYPPKNPPANVLAEFVGQLATADVALIVLTDSYAGTADGVRRWMFEEWLRIDAPHSFGLLELAWVIRDPDWYASYEGTLKPTSIFHGVIELSRQDLSDTEEFQVANISYHAMFRLPGQAYALAEQARAKNLTLPATVENRCGQRRGRAWPTVGRVGATRCRSPVRTPVLGHSQGQSRPRLLRPVAVALTGFCMFRAKADRRARHKRPRRPTGLHSLCNRYTSVCRQHSRAARHSLRSSK
jgi:hypothetical protein